MVVDKAIEGIPSTDFKPIDFTEGEDEGRYNKRLSASITDACCPDRDPVLHGGGRSRVEFCDVYTPSRQMIHVKRYAGSSVLSHLFAQGVVSATTFLSDERFREKVNKLLPVSLQIATPATKPNAADYEIAFFVASRSAGPLSLPFFSRVTLRNAYTQLTTFGFRTTLTKVQVV
ncbi:MAG TPA: TIGR04141 family sporadically distributed protein [Thermoanaerobaculia bacterium]|nr:TIGR04141 family sporadically distributed protein [Thermoanaerobaculia bacterium]